MGEFPIYFDRVMPRNKRKAVRKKLDPVSDHIKKVFREEMNEDIPDHGILGMFVDSPEASYFVDHKTAKAIGVYLVRKKK